MCCSWVGAVAAPPPRERQGGQFPRGLSPKLTPGETEAQGRSLQAAVLNPLSSPALSPAELGEEEESCCPHQGGAWAMHAGASGSTSPQHPSASAPAPYATAGNTVHCYRQRSGTEPGLSRSCASPRGHPACRDPPLRANPAARGSFPRAEATGRESPWGRRHPASLRGQGAGDP